jgi:pimeloyl-ACP methyl ester carboxylesterase
MAPLSGFRVACLHLGHELLRATEPVAFGPGVDAGGFRVGIRSGDEYGAQGCRSSLPTRRAKGPIAATWRRPAENWVRMCCVPSGPRMTVRETWTEVGGSLAHAWLLEPWMPDGAATPLVVVVPGLGLPTYTRPMARAVVSQGLGCAVLDIPGFGSGARRSALPDIHSIGRTVASWVRAHAAGRRLVVVGHSTGAQAALGAALVLQDDLPTAALVMAGPTFTPAQRRLPALLVATPAAYREDTLREISIREVARARLGLLSIIRSGMRDAPEDRLPRLRLPLTLTAGERDAYAPGPWLATLAVSAGQSAEVRTVFMPGSHNNLYTHPQQLAGVIGDALQPA